MPEITSSWAFAFIIGCFVGAIIGFFVAALCAISGQASRAEEEREARRKRLSGDDMTSQVEDILGRKVS